MAQQNERPSHENIIAHELTGRTLLKKTEAPFITDNSSTSKVMVNVIVALLPSLVIAGVIFGGRALTLTGITVITAMGAELVMSFFMRGKSAVNDLSCVVTGMLLAYTLPATCPYYIAVLGAILAIGTKEVFGGLGRNIFNPALMSRLVLTLIFNRQLTAWPIPFYDANDVMTSATPLETRTATYYDLFMGSIGGALGEVSALAILLGLFYLAAMRVTSLHIPLTFVGTVYLFSWLTDQLPLFQILSGGLLLGAVFMAADPVTTPMTSLGKIIFGLGCGAITCSIRFFTPWPEGVGIAILIMNLLTPVIDRYTEPRPRTAARSKR